MADDRIPRPLSGEIIAAPSSEPRLQRACGDIVEAEIEICPRAAEALPAGLNAPAMMPPPPSGLDALVPAPPAAPLSRRGGAAFWTAGMAFAAAAFWASGGHALVRPAFLLPQPGPAQIRVAGVTSRVEAAAGRVYLFVAGHAVNDGASPAALPELEISVTGGDGAVTRYRLAKSSRRLEAGSRTSFSSRLDLPKNGVKAVTVAVVR